MKILLSLVFLFLVIFTSCKKESIKPDPDYPDLPAYSEKGLDVGGMLINGNAWLTTKKVSLSTGIPPLQLLSYPSGDSIVILLNGNFKGQAQQNQGIETIFVVLKGVNISSDEDLMQLNDREFTLDGSTNYGGFSEVFGLNKAGRGIGTFTIGKVTVVSNVSYGDGSPGNPVRHPYIIAGRIEMDFTTTTDYSLREGRFDITILSNSNQFVVL